MESISTTTTSIGQSGDASFLHLPLSTASPDPLGFAKVSGLYGPGAWAAWFIAIVASWLHLFYNLEEAVEANQWGYLALLNWAAIDLILQVNKVRKLIEETPYLGHDAWTSEAASVGAAMNMVVWGTTNASLQLLCAYYMMRNVNREAGRRAFTLFLGVMLPSASLFISIYYLDIHRKGTWYIHLRACEMIPALYWQGMTTTGDQSNHCHAMQLVQDIGQLGAAMVLFILYHFQKQYGYTIHGLIDYYSENFPITCSICEGVSYTVYVGGLLILVLFAYFYQSWWYLVTLGMLYAPSVYVAVIGAQTASVMIQYCLTYIWRAYIVKSVDKDQSCFFMPCSPQSLEDTDQGSALLVALMLFLGMEVVVPLYTWSKKRKGKDDKEQLSVPLIVIHLAED